MMKYATSSLIQKKFLIGELLYHLNQHGPFDAAIKSLLILLYSQFIYPLV